MFKKIIFLFLVLFSFTSLAEEQVIGVKTEPDKGLGEGVIIGRIRPTTCPEGCIDYYDCKREVNKAYAYIYFDEKEHPRFSPNDADLYFTTKFLKDSFEKNKGNFVISPLSVYAATALVANGAEGKSKDELENIFLPWKNDGETLDVEKVNASLRAYMEKKTQFEINNSIWGNEFKKEYQEKMEKDLLSEANPLPENTSVINEWVKEKTKGRIQNLLGDRETDEHDLFLVNTLYFKDKWETPFEEGNTRVADFHSLDGQTDKVDMMNMWSVFFDYYEDEKMQSVRLPYENGDVMQIFLPKEGIDFSQFIQELSANDLYLAYYKVPIDLEIPRVNLDYNENSLTEFFKNWGMESIFDKEAAELSGLSDFPHYVSGIIHQATININEKGTEASAATVFDMNGSLVGKRKLLRKSWYIPFIANRPFVFMINNGDFIGVYVKGSSKLYAKQKAENESF